MQKQAVARTALRGCREGGGPAALPLRCRLRWTGVLRTLRHATAAAAAPRPSHAPATLFPLCPAGQADYLQAVRQVYLELQAAWLTPVEILQPHYGRAVAAFILHRWRQLVGW